MKNVLLIGASGFVGSKVLKAVLQKDKYSVKALVRASSKLSTEGGIETIRGDIMDKDSLMVACQGIDIVINTANGYMSGHPEIDVIGANNVVDACKANNVKRYIYCSVLTADKSQDVEHFWNKKLHEDYIKEQGIPFIALRPGGFIDQVDDYLGDGIKRGSSFCISMWDKTIPIGMLITDDLAKYFAECIDLPESANGSIIDIGLSRPISMQEVASIISTKLGGKPLRCIGLHRFVRYTVIYTIGYFRPFWAEMMHMFNYFDTGVYVNDTELQTKYFGRPPTPEEALNKWVDTLLKEKEENEKSK